MISRLSVTCKKMIRILSPSQFEKVYKTKKKGSTSTDVTAPPYTLVPFRARPAALVVFSPSPLPSGPKPRRRRLPFSNCQPPPRLCLVKPVVMPSAEPRSPLLPSPFLLPLPTPRPRRCGPRPAPLPASSRSCWSSCSRAPFRG